MDQMDIAKHRVDGRQIGRTCDCRAMKARDVCKLEAHVRNEEGTKVSFPWAIRRALET